jgi:hypothetical protein
MRSRFGASGGMAFGTPAAYGEALLRSETAPKMAQVMQQGQLAAISQLLPIFANLSGKGITQREGTLSPPAWQSAAAIALPVAGTVIGGLAGGPPGAMAGNAAGTAAAGGMSSARQPSLSNSRGWQDFQVPMPNFEMQWAPNMTPGSNSSFMLPPNWRTN